MQSISESILIVLTWEGSWNHLQNQTSHSATLESHSAVSDYDIYPETLYGRHLLTCPHTSGLKSSGTPPAGTWTIQKGLVTNQWMGLSPKTPWCWINRFHLKHVTQEDSPAENVCSMSCALLYKYAPKYKKTSNTTPLRWIKGQNPSKTLEESLPWRVCTPILEDPFIKICWTNVTSICPSLKIFYHILLKRISSLFIK